MRAPRRALSLLAVGALAAGCSSVQQHEREIEVPEAEMQQYLSDKPERLHRLYRKVLTQGERNAVLNQMRIGLAAMEIGAWDAAERAFDKALAGIETVYADSAQAEEARSTWVKENYKDFKGEPYERAMAYYYRGLLYLREGDYENARASFKGGLLQDTLAQQQTYSQDFAALAFLSGWASHCNGDPGLAESAFEEAHETNSRLTAPDEATNLLLVAETGGAPRKVAVGEYGEALAFKRGGGSADTAEMALGDRMVPLTRAEDVYFQASTRGGRQVERILEGQAQFKDTTDTVGDVAIRGGAATAAFGSAYGNDNAAMAGLGILAAGLIAKGIAAATRPEADLRAWDNLPDKVHLAALSADPVPAEAQASFRTAAGTTVASETVQIHQAGRCALGWGRGQSALAVPDAAPGSTAD